MVTVKRFDVHIVNLDPTVGSEIQKAVSDNQLDKLSGHSRYAVGGF